MDTTFAAVGDSCRQILNDLDTVGGEIFTNTFLKIPREQAYRELYNALATVQVPDINRVVYWVMDPYTTFLSPEGHMGLQDFSEPTFVEERGDLTDSVIANVSATSPIVVTTVDPHGLTTGASVTVMGAASMAAWSRWFITVLSSTTFSLNSSLTDTISGPGGTVSSSPNNFTEVQSLLRTTDRAPTDALCDYYWIDSAFQFRGATTRRELRITYRASGNPPASTSTLLGLDDSLTFLACRTACLAAFTKQWMGTYERLAQLSCGPSMTPDGLGGLLRNYLNNKVVAMQRNNRQRQRFRPRRSQPDWLLL